MAKGKTIGRPFKKGQTGNPDGSSAKRRIGAAMSRMLPELSKRAPHLTLEGIQIMMAGILAGSVGDIKTAQRELGDDLCVAYTSLVSALQVASRKGDMASILKAIEFIYGRSPDRLEVTGKDGGPIRTTSSMSLEEMEAELAAIRARKQGANK